MNRRWLCNDVWMDVLPSFDHAQLGFKMALLSPRFDALVDKHFDRKSELTIWRIIRIEKDRGPKANDNRPKPKMSILIGGNGPTVSIGGDFVDFPLSVRQLPNKICFKNLQIKYIDHSVIKFLRSKKRFYDRSGTNLELSIANVQPIWDVLAHQIWPIFATNIRHLGFRNANHLDNLRRRTSPTILTDLDQLTSIDSGRLCPEGIADFEVLNPTAGQALAKWLHTPSKNGQPKRLYRNAYLSRLNLEWVNNFKETFLRATTSVSYTIQLYFLVDTIPNEQFELVNGRTKEKLTLKMNKEYSDSVYNWLLQRRPIGESATAPIKFDLWHDNYSGANLNNIRFDLWDGIHCIG